MASDGVNCQRLFSEAVAQMGIHARAERILDAKAVGTTRAGKRPGDFFFTYEEFGAYIECKETTEKNFNFGMIKPHQLAMAKRCTQGGIHYIFPVLRMQTAELFMVHAAYLIQHIDKVRRSYATWDELAAFACPRLSGGFNMEFLVRLVSSSVAELNQEFLARYGIRNDFNHLQGS